MNSLLTLLFVAGILHFLVGVAALPAFGLALVGWVLWKLKYVILGIIGLGMLFGD